MGIETRSASGEVPTILFFEADPLVRISVAQYLRECGFLVLEVVNDTEALAVLEDQPAIDVALLDLGAAGSLQGFTVAQWIRRFRPRVRILLTAGIDKIAREAHDLCEGGPLLRKPYSHDELARRIRSLVSREPGAP
jgi:DNA-binding response OmpR family regulator